MLLVGVGERIPLPAHVLFYDVLWHSMDNGYVAKVGKKNGERFESACFSLFFPFLVYRIYRLFGEIWRVPFFVRAGHMLETTHQPSTTATAGRLHTVMRACCCHKAWHESR